MIIVDTALKKAEAEGRPIRVGIVGAGYMGRGMGIQIATAFRSGMRVSGLYNRTLSKAETAYQQANIEYTTVDTQQQIEQAVANGKSVIATDALELCKAENIDVIVEATGEVEFGAHVVMEAIKNKKHVVLMNAEIDAVCGPILKVYADKAGVVITNIDGDQPGVTD